jgi:toxin YoeB
MVMPYEASLMPAAAAQYQTWKKSAPRIVEKIDELLAAVEKDPFGGIGHPEKLKGNLSSHYSRRITKKHRFVYTVEGRYVLVWSCMNHYFND